MQYRYTFRHLEPLESIENYAKHRFEKMEKYNLHKEMKIQFIFSVQREDQMAEVLVDSGSNHYTAKAKDPSLYTAIDAVVDKLERQLLKHKEKVQEHKSREMSNEGYLKKEMANQISSQARALRSQPDEALGTKKTKYRKTS